MGRKSDLILHVMKQFVSLKFFCLLMLFPFFLEGNAKSIFYVKVDGVGNGTSWNDAAGNIQDMIKKTTAGDEIWVAGGTYYPTLDVEISVDGWTYNSKTFLLKNGICLYGGFQGNEFNIESRTKSDKNGNGTIEDWEFTYETVLSGDIDGVEDIWEKDINSHYWNVTGVYKNSDIVVYLAATEPDKTIFDGFKVKRGKSYGIYNEGTIKNCIINKNGTYPGSGVYNASNGLIVNCLVSNNASNGIFNKGEVTNCVIMDNERGVMNSGNGIIKNSIVNNNFDRGIDSDEWKFDENDKIIAYDQK